MIPIFDLEDDLILEVLDHLEVKFILKVWLPTCIR